MPDQVDIPQVLLERARDDELAARSLLPVEGVTDAILGFHTQQAVEKSLKAVLALRGVEFPYTHDIDGLLELFQNNGLDVPDELSDADSLSSYAVRLRYDARHQTRLDRDQALRWAAAAVEWARQQIEPADGPGRPRRTQPSRSSTEQPTCAKSGYAWISIDPPYATGTSVSPRWAKWWSKANASVIPSRSIRAKDVASTWLQRLSAWASRIVQASCSTDSSIRTISIASPAWKRRPHSIASSRPALTSNAV